MLLKQKRHFTNWKQEYINLSKLKATLAIKSVVAKTRWFYNFRNSILVRW